MPWHVVVEYNQQYRKIGGWSENFYTSSAALADAEADANRLCVVLAQCHGFTSQPEAFSVRLLPTPPAVMVSRVNKYVSLVGNAPGVTNTVGNQSDFPTTALSIQLSNGGGAFKTTQWLKGIPDNCCTKAVYTPTPAFQGAFQALQRELISSPGNPRPWVMHIKDYSLPKIRITGYTQAGVVTVPGNTLAVNDLVRVGLVTSPSGRESEGSNANGKFRVLSVVGDNVQILIPTPLTSVPVLGPSSYMNKLLPAYIQIDDVQAVGITKKDIGGPKGKQSGKKKRRR